MFRAKNIPIWTFLDHVLLITEIEYPNSMDDQILPEGYVMNGWLALLCTYTIIESEIKLKAQTKFNNYLFTQNERVAYAKAQQQ